ncbi:cytochrome c oxidase subunit 5B, mitochondrial-like [Eriocheir sinensis]|uniref:cytochrome c oxidase subunit 5B, mitochondrial-like n=1 Tax=Eriocheir sinensis TaxID=95602 RepID=UPI0021C5E5EA|nr:cytochrome c oxidase subunit 5B, mitochondrial-like [Eriocheir sinensis]
MAALIARSVARTARQGVQVTSIRCANKMMADPLEHATGLEKQEMLAKAAGNDNFFDMRVYKRVSGAKANPTVVPSFYEKRLVGCICEEDATCINWMWLEKGETKRCECGYWFQLADAKPGV